MFLSKRMKNCCSLWVGFVFLVSLSIFTGCASTDDIGRMQWDINQLRSDINKIRKNSQSTTRMEAVNKQLDAIEESQKTNSTTISDLMIQVQSLTSEFQVLTGRFEESKYFSEKSATELLEDKNTLSEKIRELELAMAELEKKTDKALIPPPPPPQPVPLKKETTKTVVTAPGQKMNAVNGSKSQKDTVKDLYMSAYESYNKGNLDEARQSFGDLIKNYPENDYSDNARFWMGEVYYKEGKFEDAILSYQELFDKNPKSDKVPGAMLKQGLAFYALKDEKTGSIILEKLIEKYPFTEQAKLAKRKLSKRAVPSKTN